jgi:hypothetical protein
MNATSAPTRGRNLRRSVVRASVVGAVASIAAASVTSAVPSEPDESMECHPYGTAIDDCGFYPDPPDDGGGSSNGSGGSSSSGGCHGSDSYGFDIVKITSTGIDFGDSSYVAGAPLGPGSVNWSVPDCDWYTAGLVGTLHLDNVSGQYGRMHVSYWWGGQRVATRHSAILHVTDNGHEDMPVNMPGSIGTNVDEVHVCTEISDDGVNFDQVECKERVL